MKKCQICGKGIQIGHKVSHSNRKSPKKWEPNLQKVKTKINGKITRIRVCTKCLKKGKIIKAV